MIYMAAKSASATEEILFDGTVEWFIDFLAESTLLSISLTILKLS